MPSEADALEVLWRTLARRRLRDRPWLPLATGALSALAILLGGVLGLWLWKAYAPQEGYAEVNSLYAVNLESPAATGMSTSPLTQVMPSIWTKLVSRPERPAMALARSVPTRLQIDGSASFYTVDRLLVSSEWFDVTGLNLRHGRRPEVDSREVLIRQRVARQWFGSETAALGQQLSLDGGPSLRVVGVYANAVLEPQSALEGGETFALIEVIDPSTSNHAFALDDEGAALMTVAVRWTQPAEQLRAVIAQSLAQLDARTRTLNLHVRPLGDLLSARARQALPALAALTLLVVLAASSCGSLLLTTRFADRLRNAAVLATIGVDAAQRTRPERHELRVVMRIAGGVALLALTGFLWFAGDIPGIGAPGAIAHLWALGGASLVWILLLLVYAPTARIAATARPSQLTGPRVVGPGRAPRWLLQMLQGLQLLLALVILAAALDGLRESFRAQRALAATSLEGLVEVRVLPPEPVAASRLHAVMESIRDALPDRDGRGDITASTASVLDLRTENLYRAFRGMRPTGTEEVSMAADGSSVVRMRERPSGDAGTQAELDYRVALVAAEAPWLANAGYRLHSGRVYAGGERAVVASRGAYASLHPDGGGLEAPLPTFTPASQDPIWNREVMLVGVIDSPRLLTRAGVGGGIDFDQHFPPVFAPWTSLRSLDIKLDGAYLLFAARGFNAARETALRQALPPGWTHTQTVLADEAARRLREHWLATGLMLAVGMLLAGTLVMATSAVFSLLVGQRASEIAMRRILGASALSLKLMMLRREYLPALAILFAAVMAWQMATFVAAALRGTAASAHLQLWLAFVLVSLAALFGALAALRQALAGSPAQVLRSE